MNDINLEIYNENRKFTGEEACKLILWHWSQEPEKYYSCRGKDLKDLNYKDIWGYSPNGELICVFIWWQEAIKYYHNHYEMEVWE